MVEVIDGELLGKLKYSCHAHGQSEWTRNQIIVLELPPKDFIGS